MKAYRIYSGRKQDALELIEHTASKPTAREVRVRVRAVSLNYRDLMIAWGQYPIASDPPPIAVADGAGEVIAVGPQVTRFKAMFEDLNWFVTAAKIRPTIDRVFGFDQAREAYAYLEAAKHFGKVAIKVGD